MALLAGASNPNGPFYLAEKQPPTAGEWRDLLELPGGGLVRVGAMPPSSEDLSDAFQEDDELDGAPNFRPAQEQFVAEAKKNYDIVVIDVGNGFQQPHLAELADLVMAVVPYKRHEWFETEVVDRRPDWVRFLAWLDDQYLQYSLINSATTPVEQLLTFLDIQFAFYVMDRAEDGNPDVYSADDPEDLNDWWSDYDYADRVGEGDYVELPSEDEAPELDAWRRDFLDFVRLEGARRHLETWTEASEQWSARSRQRNEQGLCPGQSQDDEAAHTRFLRNIEDKAIQRWGDSLWQDQHSVWAAAREAGDDLLAPWQDLVEKVQHTRPAADIARKLTVEAGLEPTSSTLIVLNQTDYNLGRHDLAAVRDALQNQGFATAVTLPRLKAFEELLYSPSELAKQGGLAAGAANRIALAVSSALRHQ